MKSSILNNLKEMNDVKKAQKRTRCEVYSRIIGYLSPVDRWNKGKEEEWRKRRTYCLGKKVS